MQSASKSKNTPQKHITKPHSHQVVDETLSKDLFSPFFDNFSTSILNTLTPLRKQPEYLLSPSPVKKDLFSQLLGT